MSTASRYIWFEMHAIKSVILERSQVEDNWELPTNIGKKPTTSRGDRRKLPTSPKNRWIIDFLKSFY